MLDRAAALLRGCKRVEWIIGLCALAALILLLTANASAPAPSALEARVAAALTEVAGAGRVRVVINEDAGVLVVARGATDLQVSLALAQAVEALLDVEPSRIEVLPMQ